MNPDPTLKDAMDHIVAALAERDLVGFVIVQGKPRRAANLLHVAASWTAFKIEDNGDLGSNLVDGDDKENAAKLYQTVLMLDKWLVSLREAAVNVSQVRRSIVEAASYVARGEKSFPG